MSAAATEVVDGRLLRGQRTRRAITEAYVALLEEGVRNPRAEDVAVRAGVGVRTVYNQFNDIEGLRAEAGRIREEHLRDIWVAAPSPDAPLEERVRVLAQARARFLIALTPFARAAEGTHHESPELSRQRDELVAVGLRQLQAFFAPELAARKPRERTRLLHALHASAGYPAWSALTEELGLDEREAQACLETTLRALLTS